jgi:hypothetical protein
VKITVLDMAILCMIAAKNNPPLISRLAASGGPMTAILSTPSSKDYDGSGRFRRRARQVCQKSAESNQNHQQCVWGQEYVIQPNKVPQQSC